MPSSLNIRYNYFFLSNRFYWSTVFYSLCLYYLNHVSCVCNIICYQLFHIDLKKFVFASITTVQSTMCASILVHYGLKYSCVCILHYLTVIVMQIYLDALNIQNAFQVYSVKCVSICVDMRIYLIKLIISIIAYEIWFISRCVVIAYETRACAICLAMFSCTFIIVGGSLDIE